MTKITIIGAGAMGGVTGAFMARAGEDVTLVDAVPEHVQAIQEQGLRMDGLAEFTVQVPAVMPEKLQGPLDLVFIAVKTQHTDGALDAVEPHFGPDSVVVPLQNGLSALWIAERIGKERVVPTSITTHQFYMGPGHVRYLNPGVVHVGEFEGGISPRVEEIVRVLSHAYEAHATSNVWGWIWGKMIAGSIIFTTALVDATMGETIAASDAHKRMFIRMGGEAVAVAQASGIEVEPAADLEPALLLPRNEQEWQAAMEMMDRYAELTREVHSGVWRDIAVRKRRTEANTLIAPMIAEGEKVGQPMPLHRAMLRILNEIEDGKRSQGWDNLEELIHVSEQSES